MTWSSNTFLFRKSESKLASFSPKIFFLTLSTKYESYFAMKSSTRKANLIKNESEFSVPSILLLSYQNYDIYWKIGFKGINNMQEVYVKCRFMASKGCGLFKGCRANKGCRSYLWCRASKVFISSKGCRSSRAYLR